ncbi:MAG: 50S ribosomal protein L25 [Candidatus Anoxychlamydiales bacterium]|nr:50S ribosomal protein L25 [Candidatus Anoxychlamydiales bacterium]
MELSIFKREKKQIKKLRHLGNIPAVVYAKGKENENIYLKKEEVKKQLAKLEAGNLSNCIFTLKGEKETFKAIVKDIQYFIINYDIMHLDFMKIDEKSIITTKVPVRCIGINECVGIKQGGNYRQVIRAMKVKCLPKDLPKEFIIDIANMSIGDVRRLSDLELPKGVISVSRKLNEVVVTITKR